MNSDGNFQIESVLNNKIDQYTISQKFWLVRTEAGHWYNDFTRNNFIAVGWDDVPNLSTYPLETDHKNWRKNVIQEIRKIYPGKSEGGKVVRAGYIFSQLHKFEQLMRVGDYVIVPSEASYEIAVGRINSLEYSDFTRRTACENECNYKRKYRVDWIAKIKKSALKEEAASSFYSQHTIVDLSNHADDICRNIYKLYIINERIHFSFPISMQRNLTAEELFSFSKLLDIADGIGSTLDISFSRKDLEVKVSLQSPGDFHFIASGRQAIMGTVFMALLFASCAENQNEKNGYGLSDAEANMIKSIPGKGNEIEDAQKSIVKIDSTNNELVKAATELKLLADKEY